MARSDARPEIDRRTAAIATVPFLALGVANVALVLRWGATPLWGFVVLLPIVFIATLTWFAFRTVP